MKKKGDVKFIIYQSLYIFVVCVVAIKGASLDLTQVINDDGKPKVFLTPDSLDKLLEIIKKSIIVDTNLYVIIAKSDLANMDKRIQELVIHQQPQLTVTQPQITQPIIEKKPEEEKKIEPTEMQEIRIGQISLTQFTQNSLNNPYDVPMEIVGITTIPPKSTKTFTTGGEGSVVIKVGSSTKTIELKPNQKPKISFQRIASMGEDTRVTQLQSSVCYRVTIEDDFPGQLDIKFSGPVTVKEKGSYTYDITMNAFSSKAAFDNFTENKSSPYSTGFTVTVTDKIAGHKIAGQQSFIFGEW
jgi:hypothetical protein